jgi:CheY-like chemotaxis protein
MEPHVVPCAKRVLVVDDDFDVRNVMSILLRAEGYEVVTAANGQEALECLQRGARPDLILLDLMMPVMDGWQFLQIKQRDPTFAQMPVIAITAVKSTHSLEIPCLEKPLSFEQLLKAVKTYCGEGEVHEPG